MISQVGKSDTQHAQRLADRSGTDSSKEPAFSIHTTISNSEHNVGTKITIFPEFAKGDVRHITCPRGYRQLSFPVSPVSDDTANSPPRAVICVIDNCLLCYQISQRNLVNLLD